MKKMYEMERNIQLRADSWGFKVLLLVLAAWSLYTLFSRSFFGGERNVWPMFLLTAGLLTQQFCILATKRKMVAGDEEYKENNTIVRVIVLGVAALALVLSIGSALFAWLTGTALP